MELDVFYFELWENEESKTPQTQEEEQEQETETPTQTDFFIFNDGVKQNREVLIIDSKDLELKNQRPFKVIGRLSQKERRLLKKIR